MCFYLRDNKRAIAHEDIVVYKKLRVYTDPENRKKRFGSLYYPKIWKRGTLSVEVMKKDNRDKSYPAIGEGLHSGTYSRCAEVWYTPTVVVKMFIPKGSAYYWDYFRGEYVSTALYFPLVNETSSLSLIDKIRIWIANIKSV